MQLKHSALRLIPAALAGLLLIGLTADCHGPGSKRTIRYRRSMLQKSLQRFETVGLSLGEFGLPGNAVLDGDTIRVTGLKTTMRLLAIDTEETFKRASEKQLYGMGWEHYVKTLTKGHKKPRKYASPLGTDGKVYAEKFFDGVKIVRLERDHPKEIRGRFGRYLTYVFAKKNGKWVNYNIECVRAGMSPYFTKYSYSRRFHKEFVAAQAEARAAKLGIWDSKKEHYPDYDQRIAWWNARADFIRQFEKDAEGKSNYIILTNWDSLRRLGQNLNKKVVILGLVGRIKLGDKGPTKVMLARRRGADFPLVFFDKDAFGSSRIARFKGEFVRVTGRIKNWHNKFRNRDELQIVVNLPTQIVGSDKVPDYSRWYPEKPGSERDY